MAGSVRAGRVGPTTTGAHAGSLHWRQEGDAASRLLHHPARSITGHPAALFKGKSSLRHSLTASINQPANCFSFSQIPEFIGFQLIVRTFKVIPEFRNSGIPEYIQLESNMNHGKKIGHYSAGLQLSIEFFAELKTESVSRWQGRTKRQRSETDRYRDRCKCSTGRPPSAGRPNLFCQIPKRLEQAAN